MSENIELLSFKIYKNSIWSVDNKKMILTYVHKDLFLLSTYKWSYPWCASSKMSYFRGKYYIQIFKKNLLGYKSCKQ